MSDAQVTATFTGDDGPGGGSEEPTAAAFLKITTKPDWPDLTVSVPGTEANRMLEAVELVCGIGGIALAPFLMAKALEIVSPDLPWEAGVACMIIAAILPLAVYWLAKRHK